jgi:hypothetical protein
MKRSNSALVAVKTTTGVSVPSPHPAIIQRDKPVGAAAETALPVSVVAASACCIGVIL